VNGEAVLSVIDESLLALKSNDKDIVDFFYSDVKNNVKTLYNLKNIIKRFEFKKESVNISESDSNFRVKSSSI
jgi:uncharacterized protein YfaS (alpha-2-macroglobulin family)